MTAPEARRAHLAKTLRISDLRDRAEFVDALAPADRERAACENHAAWEAWLAEVEAAR